MSPTILSMLIGLAVIVVVMIVASVIQSPSEAAEERLTQLTSPGRRSSGRSGREDISKGLLLRPVGLDFSVSRRWLPNLEGLAQLFEQANVSIEFRKFLMIPGGLFLVGAVLGFSMGVGPVPAVLGAFGLGCLPFFWLVFRKRRRIKQFIAQMPDALELVGRALRAGHGLASGLKVVAEEMAPPISEEFGRVFEEQNLGIPLEDALRGLAERVPQMEVRFFTTAVIIQRSTGGDLSEVLDKIGRLIRERFQILGQVQALTAEGRLSGIILLAMPPGMLFLISMINPEYASLLFTTSAGTKMLMGAAVLQLLGAVAIKKIVTIKV